MTQKLLNLISALKETSIAMRSAFFVEHPVALRRFAFFYLGYVCLCLLFPRANDILSLEWADSFLSCYEILLIGLAAIFSLILFPGFYILFVAIAGMVLIHAFVSYYTPSLTWSTPLEDYLLSSNVSANWSYERARYFIRLVFLHLPSAIVFWKSWNTLDEKIQESIRRHLYLLASLLLMVAAIQVFYDKNFLATGSGSAVKVNRAPSLLEDSAAATLFFSILYIYVLFAPTKKRLPAAKICNFTFLLAIATVGIYGLGRTFVVLALVFSLLKITTLLIKRSLKFKSFLILTILALGWIGSQHLEKVQGIQNISKTFEGIKKAAPHLIDRTRYTHIMASLWGIEKSLPEGMGFGSFDALTDSFFRSKSYNYRYMNRAHDWPTNFYLQLVVELGIAGLILILLLFIPIAIKILNPKMNRQFVLYTFVLISWTVGVHFVFRSIAPLFALIIVASFSEAGRSQPKKLFGFSILVALIIQSLSLYYGRSDQHSHWVEFKNVLNGPNRFRESIDGQKGEWIRSGSETVLDNENLAFLTKNPSFDYPLVIDVIVFNEKKEEVLRESFTHSTPREKTYIDVSNLKCGAPSLSDYCYAKIVTSKEWVWQQQPLAVFIIKDTN
jgi:hypothetical protein